MVHGKEKIFEAIVGPEWNKDESDGTLYRYDRERKRRFSYKDWSEHYEGVIFVEMGMSAINDKGGWDEIFSMNHYTTEDGEKMSFSILVCENDSEPHFNKMVFFTTHQNIRSVGGGVIEDKTYAAKMPKPTIGFYEESQIPNGLDYEMTANLFINQMVRGDFDQPVLVPKGLFAYKEPVEMAGGAMAYAPNITLASQLIARAKTPEEYRVAEKIYAWVVDQEVAGR